MSKRPVLVLIWRILLLALLSVAFVIASLVVNETTLPKGTPIWIDSIWVYFFSLPKILWQFAVAIFGAISFIVIFIPSADKKILNKILEILRQRFPDRPPILEPAERDEIARKFQIPPSMVDALADILKNKLGIADEQLAAALYEQVKNAHRLRDETEQLRAQLATGDPARAALQRAKAAIDAGRFGDAEREYAAVSTIGWEQRKNGQQTWEAAIDGQAAAAILAGENDRADAIRVAAAEKLRARRAAADSGEREQWEKIAEERYQEGLVYGRSAALERSIAVYRQHVLPQLSETETPVAWAATQNSLGIVLKTQGERTGGQPGLDFLTQAVDAYRAALRVYTEAQMPVAWAATQNNLGNVLRIQDERTRDQPGLDFLIQAMDACRAALRVRTEAQMPVDWAMTQNNLGNVLETQGERTGGQQGLKLLAQAVEAYRAALRVYTETERPVPWAATQNNLGTVLSTQGERTGGEPGLKLLAQAVEAYRAALRVRTEAQMPVDWAMTQNNLGAVLSTQGERTGGQPGLDFLTEAVDAYRAALRVYTEAQMAVAWAATQNNLGAVLSIQGERTSGQPGLELLTEAVDAYRAALRVRTEAEAPVAWAATQNNLGNVLRIQGERTDGQPGLDLLADAVAAFRAALRVFNQAEANAYAEKTQRNLDWVNALMLKKRRTV
ncbi:MAG: tetratricopeptide repeat protein [Burkholderiaceae bacterium]|jgi:tetratricopeptide (TPR) repeat protein|nr:tetratricopeptide repeat protein [Burkholderiaceae bacterium]